MSNLSDIYNQIDRNDGVWSTYDPAVIKAYGLSQGCDVSAINPTGFNRKYRKQIDYRIAKAQEYMDPGNPRDRADIIKARLKRKLKSGKAI